ncbi:hypothetical protein Ahia01_001004400 [Argonauta hians]
MNETEGQSWAHAVKQYKTKRENYNKKNEILKCRYCGRSHARAKEECPAWGKECNFCGKENHFSSVCFRKTEENRTGIKKKIHTIQEKDEHCLAVGKENKKTIKAEMKINGKQLICQIDSGASVNVISRRNVGRSPLQKTNTSLHVYNGATIDTLGKTNLKIFNPRTKESMIAEFVVVDDDFTTLIGKTTSENVKLITVHYDNLIVAKVEESTNILDKYADVFADEQGNFQRIAHLEVDETITPSISPSGKIPLAIKTKVKQELDRLENNDVITKVDEPTSWCSRMIVATKKSGKMRICIDPRPLNKALRRERYPIPTMDDILPRLAKSTVFTKLDLTNAYWHVHLDDKSSLLTTFQTPFGRYRWKRLPFGTCVSSEIFQKRLDQALEGLEGVIGISDDIIVHGKDTEEHDKSLTALLERCRKIGIRLNRCKTELRKSNISFLGHLVTKEGLQIDPEKLEAVKEMPRPKDVEGVRRFCGFINYLAQFLPRLSEVLEPIRQLTREDVPWMWTHTQEAAFKKVKELATQAPVLSYYNPTEELYIQCDASQSGLGVALLQRGQPLAFSSRALTTTERNYAQIEKELLAIII